MGSFNANMLPATNGLALGNQNQQWLAYLSNCFATTIQSQSANPALSGFVRLASTDTVAWRNAANTADVSLASTGAAAGNVPADSLKFNGGSLVGTFISSSLNPAATGGVRLATGDTLSFRNAANSGDVVGVQHNSDDTVTVGGANGIKAGATVLSGNLSTTGTLAVTGSSTLANLNLSSGSITTTASTLSIQPLAPSGPGVGYATTVSGGNATGGGSNAGGNLILSAGGSSGAAPAATILLSSSVSSYNSITTAGNGIPAEYAAVDALAQTAAITTTTLYAVPSAVSLPRLFRLSWSAKIVTAATTGASTSTLGALTIVYTDHDGVAVTLTCGAMIAAGSIATTSTANTTGTVLMGIPLILNCQQSSNITYAFAYASNTAAQMAYDLHVRLEAL